MADNIGPINLGVGYGSPAAAGFYGLQQELLRRAELQRQAQLDEERRAKDALAAEATRENIASSKVQREAQAQLNTEKATALAADQYAKTHGIGAVIDPTEKPTVLKLFGPGAVLSGTPAVSEVPAAGPVNPKDVAEGVDTLGGPQQAAQPATPDTFAGTEAQQGAAAAKQMAHAVLNGEYDSGDEDVNATLRGWALSTLMTGKATNIPAGVLNPKSKTQAEKDSTRYFNTRAAQTLKQSVAPADAAFADAYERLHPTEATKQANRVDVQIRGIDATNKRQTSTQTFQTKQQFRRELTDNEKNVDKDIERSDRALALLNSPNFVTDAVAGPEFLQIVAGGMGSGLRMTDAELNRINQAQTKIDQFKGQLAKWDVLGVVDRKTIQDEMRGQMRSALEAVHAARERKAKLAEETLHGLEDADTQAEIDALHAKYWSDRREQAAMSGTPAAAAPTKSKYKVTVQ